MAEVRLTISPPAPKALGVAGSVCPPARRPDSLAEVRLTILALDSEALGVAGSVCPRLGGPIPSPRYG
jgi:hypothetical protein